MRLTGEALGIFVEEFKALAYAPGELNNRFGEQGILTQKSRFAMGEILKASVKSLFNAQNGPDMFFGILHTNTVSDTPIKGSVLETDDTRMVFHGETLLELMTFMVKAYMSKGYPVHGFHKHKVLEETTMGNCYYALNIMLANTGLYGTARRKGLKRAGRTFSNYAGYYTRSVEWIENNFKVQVPVETVNELHKLMLTFNSFQSGRALLDFPTLYVKKTADNLTIDVVTVNMLDFIMCDTMRLDFESKIDALGQFDSLGKVLGYTDLPLSVRQPALTAAIQTGVFNTESTDFQTQYREFLNSIFWFDIVPQGMILMYSELLQNAMKQSVLKVNFVKSNGVLREMVSTMNKDTYIKVVPNQSLRHLVPSASVGINAWFNCITVFDLMAADVENGITRNIKLNHILDFAVVEESELKGQIVDMKVTGTILEGVLKRVVRENMKYGKLPMDLEVVLGLEGKTKDMNYDDVMSVLHQKIINESTVFMPKAYLAMLKYPEGCDEAQAIKWMKSFREWLNIDYYIDMTPELLHRTPTEQMTLIDSYAKNSIIYVEYISSKSTTIEVEKYGYFTKNKEIMGYIYGDVFNKGPFGRSLKQQFEYVSDVCKEFFENTKSFDNLVKSALLFGIEVGGKSPTKIYNEMVALKADIWNRYEESRAAVNARMTDGIIYGLYNVMIDPEFLPNKIDFFASLKVENVKCLKILDVTKVE